MSTPATKPVCVSLHRLGQLPGKARGTLLLSVRDGELVADAHLDLGSGLHRCSLQLAVGAPGKPPQPRVMNFCAD